MKLAACRLAVLGVLALALTGCVRLERERAEKRFYMIEATRPSREIHNEPMADGMLRVRRIGISPAYESASFVYRTGEAAYESDYYNAFFIAPDALLTDQVSRWMDAAGLFGRVAPGGSHMRGEYLLEGSVLSLYGDYRPGAGPDAVIELQLALLKDGPEGLTLLHHGTYAGRERLREGGPEGLVAAWSLALAGILEQAEGDLARALSTAAAEGPEAPASE